MNDGNPAEAASRDQPRNDSAPTARAVSALSHCPDAQTLSSFSLGTLSLADWDTVAEHLSNCPSCESSLGQLQAASDAIVEAVRRAGRTDTSHDSDCAGLVERIEQIGQNEVQPGQPTSLGQIGTYQLLNRLGGGGMGEVYRALHTVLGKVVALKIVAPRRVNNPDAVRRFQREMKAVGRLDHPNIVAAHDAGQADGVHYLTMELIDGVDLGALVKRHGPLNVADACELVRQAAVALAHIDQHGLVHRDLKPSNLMLTRAGQVKVLDLGLALLNGEPGAEGGVTTVSQAELGTADYMAPEQIDNAHAVDIRADIYSLGCTLFQLLTGRAPYSGPEYANVMQKLYAHVHVPPPELNAARSGIPAELLTIVGRTLAKRPRDRFARPQELAAALTPFVADAQLPRLFNSVRTKDIDEVDNPDAALVSTATYQGYRVTDSVARGKRVYKPIRWWGACTAAVVLAGSVWWLIANRAQPQWPAGSVVLEIDQAGAEVLIDHQKRLVVEEPGEQIPLRVELRSASGNDGSQHELRVSKPGFEPYIRSFSLVPQERRHIQVALMKLGPEIANTKPAPSPAVSQAVTEKEREVATWVIGLGGWVSISPTAERKTIGVKELSKLPIEPFTVYSVYLQDIAAMNDEELSKLLGLSRLGILYLNNTPITDVGVAKLERLTTLNTLNLSGTRVSDDGLKRLQNLTQLLDLTLTDTQVTDSGVEALQKSLPGCKVQR